MSRGIWIRPSALESRAEPWGSFRCLRQSPGRLEWPEGLRNFLELCFGSYIQAVSISCLRIAPSWNKTEKKKKERDPLGLTWKMVPLGSQHFKDSIQEA